jgi:hypothetical protein
MSHLYDTRYHPLTGSQIHGSLYGGSITSGASKFTKAWANRAIAVGKAYYGKPSLDTVTSFIPNFSDSMSQIIPGSSDFNQELYDTLTDSEKAQLIADQGLKAVNPLNMIPFIGLFQNTREGAAEMIGVRHPEILDNAIDRYNADILKKKNETKNDAQRNMALDKRQEIEIFVQNAGQSNKTFPTTDLVRADTVPIDALRGRGLPLHHQRIRHKININF